MKESKYTESIPGKESITKSDHLDTQSKSMASLAARRLIRKK